MLDAKVSINPYVPFADFVKATIPHIQRPTNDPITAWRHNEGIVARLPLANRLIIGNSRQIGTSTLLSIYLLWQAVAKPDIIIGAISNQLLYEIMWLHQFISGQQIETASRNLITFRNGTKIMMSADDRYFGRGLSFDILILDQFAFSRHPEDVLQSIFPCVQKGQLIITSAYKEGSLFDQILGDALRGRNEFEAAQLFWYDHDDRDEAWARKTIEIIGKEAFCQEYLNRSLPKHIRTVEELIALR